MATFPYFPLWTDAYLADTQHLTTEEHGAYLLLLFQAWRTADCSLPNDDVLLARHAGLTPAKWKGVKSIVMAFWTLDGRRNRWVQKRLKKERAKAVKKSRSAKDSATNRWKQTKKADAIALRSQSYPEPESEKPTGFSKRASAQKTRGWVQRKSMAQVTGEFIKEIDGYDSRREGEGLFEGPDEVVHGVQLLRANGR